MFYCRESDRLSTSSISAPIKLWRTTTGLNVECGNRIEVTADNPTQKSEIFLRVLVLTLIKATSRRFFRSHLSCIHVPGRQSFNTLCVVLEEIYHRLCCTGSESLELVFSCFVSDMILCQARWSNRLSAKASTAGDVKDACLSQ